MEFPLAKTLVTLTVNISEFNYLNYEFDICAD